MSDNDPFPFTFKFGVFLSPLNRILKTINLLENTFFTWDEYLRRSPTNQPS